MQQVVQCAARRLGLLALPRAVPSATATSLVRRQHTAAKEFAVPVPWGYIAGKEWGPPDGHRVLAFHGIQDNSGSYDRLVPLLPDHFRVVSYDFPGFGLSTPTPDGFYPSIASYAMDVSRVLRHLGWDRYDVIGHSLGGAVALYYAAMFPEQIGRMVCLDPAKPFAYLDDESPALYAGRVTHMWNIEDRAKQEKLITMDEAIRQTMAKSGDSLTEESARVMLRRGCRMVDDDKGLVTINRDAKSWVVVLPEFGLQQTEAFARVLTELDILAVLPRQGNIPIWALEMDAVPYPEFAKALRAGGRYIEVEIEGTHHAHLNNPEWVAPHVAQFLDQGRVGVASTTSAAGQS